MPKARARTTEERYVPSTLFMIKEVAAGGTVKTVNVLDFRHGDMAIDDRLNHAEKAVRLAEHTRVHLQLGRRERLASCIPLHYREERGGQPVENHGAVIVVAGTDDKTTHILKDNEYRPASYTDADVVFSGALADMSAALDAEIVANFGPDVDVNSYETARTRAQKAYWADVVELRPGMEMAEQQTQIQPTYDGVVTQFASASGA